MSITAMDLAIADDVQQATAPIAREALPHLPCLANRGATIRAVVPKLTSMIVLLALNSSAWAAASGAPPAGRVSPPTRATTPLAPMASSSVVARPAPQSKGLDLSAATPEAMPSPFYKRWPFWTAVGVAVGAAVVVAAGILARGNNDVNLGYPTFGTKEY